ncbi:MAG TPA: membrane bound O-acyl transferase family-domain-containing protein [Fimbriimonadaceae bacterium]|nr:membrane bound O-acyl transferase family-domain-containing protein [Fimbriimonadaceae bacterium]
MERDWILLLACSILTPHMVRPLRVRKLLVWALPVFGIFLLWLHRDAAPWARLLAASAGMLYVVKGAIMASYSLDEARRLGPLVFLIWPGMDPERLARREESTERDAYPIARGLAWLYGGLAFLLLAALLPVSKTIAGWLGIAGLLLVIHFGLSELLSSVFRLAGRGVRPLFDRPCAARTLSDFWTRRWNLAFVEMDRRLFLPSLLKRFGYRGAILGVFLVSGLLHEMAISYPAGGGWGLPFAYFTLQGLLVLGERRVKIPPALHRWLTWAAVLLPLSLVFTAQFREVFVTPMLEALRGVLTSHPVAWYYDRALWVMGFGHFLVLVASFQVPKKLGWKEELPRLSPFNRKLMVAYGAFIVLTIVAFGTFTLLLHRDLLMGSRTAVFFAGFIATFWLLRIGLDCFYYRHEDWPRGKQFVVGHALLTSLFLFLSLSYGGLVVWHLATA